MDIYDDITSCRTCYSKQLIQILELGKTPLADQLFATENAALKSPRVPLTLVLCDACFQVQLKETVHSGILFPRDYPYETGTSSNNSRHFRELAANIIERFKLNHQHTVLDIGCNDGTFLEIFHKQGIGTLGVDPAKECTLNALQKGIPVVHTFFSREAALNIREQGYRFDIITLNNVIGHIADIHSVLEGIAILLKESGTVIVEIPYLKSIISNLLFEYIFHQHIFYYSVKGLARLFRQYALHLNDLELTDNQGGSFRAYFSKTAHQLNEERIEQLTGDEAELRDLQYYQLFNDAVSAFRQQTVEKLAVLSSKYSRIAGYGAAGKSTTLLSYLGIETRYFRFIADASPKKQNKYLGGTDYRITPPSAIIDQDIEVIIILVRNLEQEITGFLRNNLGYQGLIYSINDIRNIEI